MKTCRVCDAQISPASKSLYCSDVCKKRYDKHEARMRKIERDAKVALALLMGEVERDTFGTSHKRMRVLRSFQVKLTRVTQQPTLFDRLDIAWTEDENEPLDVA